MPAISSPVVELRQYTLHPATRETLIRVFDDHFIEGQERHGMRIIGQFRDCADPNRFVWLRGFADMEARRQALEGFYGGPVWAEHGPAANATMVDHTNVLLLKPAGPDDGFRFDPDLRPPLDVPDGSDGVLAVTIHHLGPAASRGTVALLTDEIRAAFEDLGAALLAMLVTEPAPNTFPRLPVREENVLVRVTSHAGEADYRRSLARLVGLPRWKTRIAPQIEALGNGQPPEELVLRPTGRSFLRHRP